MTDRFEFDLQLFADGAAAGESGTAEGTNTGVTEAAAALQNNGRKNPLANVQYGIQDEEQPPVAEAEEKAPDRESAFEEMIKGEYKDLFERRMREAVQKRLKGTKDTVDRYKALTPVVEMLERRYGVKAGDAEALREAIEEDKKRYFLGRYARPEEVAQMAIYLLSDAAQWITGSDYYIDGGHRL